MRDRVRGHRVALAGFFRSAASSEARDRWGEYFGQGSSYQKRPHAVWIAPFWKFGSICSARESRSLNFDSIPWRRAVITPIPSA